MVDFFLKLFNFLISSLVVEVVGAQLDLIGRPCKSEPGDWLTPEVASLFATHVLPEMTPLELTMALPALVPTATPQLCQQIASIATAALLTQNDTAFSAGERGALRLSLRVLLRLTRQAAASDAKLRVLLHEALMSRFLPWRLQDTIDGWLEVAGLSPKQDPCSTKCTVQDSFRGLFQYHRLQLDILVVG